MKHRTTDPACVQHRPPTGWWSRWRFDRGRGRECVPCWEDRVLGPKWARCQRVTLVPPSHCKHPAAIDITTLTDRDAQRTAYLCETCAASWSVPDDPKVAYP